MTNQITSSEFEVVVLGQAELRQDLKDMAKEHREDMRAIADSQIDLNNKFATYIERSEHTDKELEEVKTELHGDKGINVRLGDVEKAQAGNKVRWQVLATGLITFIGLAGTFVAIVLWVLDK